VTGLAATGNTATRCALRNPVRMLIRFHRSRVQLIAPYLVERGALTDDQTTHLVWPRPGARVSAEFFRSPAARLHSQITLCGGGPGQPASDFSAIFGLAVLRLTKFC
jgi:hypothetical protein